MISGRSLILPRTLELWQNSMQNSARRFVSKVTAAFWAEYCRTYPHNRACKKSVDTSADLCAHNCCRSFCRTLCADLWPTSKQNSVWTGRNIYITLRGKSLPKALQKSERRQTVEIPAENYKTWPKSLQQIWVVISAEISAHAFGWNLWKVLPARFWSKALQCSEICLCAERFLHVQSWPKVLQNYACIAVAKWSACPSHPSIMLKACRNHVSNHAWIMPKSKMIPNHPKIIPN